MSSNPENGRTPPYGPVLAKRLENQGADAALEMRNFSLVFQNVEDATLNIQAVSQYKDSINLHHDVCAYGTLNFLFGDNHIPLSLADNLQDPYLLENTVDHLVKELNLEVSIPTTSSEFVQLLLDPNTIGSLVTLQKETSLKKPIAGLSQLNGMLHLIAIKHIPNLDGDLSAHIEDEDSLSEYFVLLNINSHEDNHIYLVSESDLFGIFAISGFLDEFHRSVLVFQHKEAEII